MDHRRRPEYLLGVGIESFAGILFRGRTASRAAMACQGPSGSWPGQSHV